RSYASGWDLGVAVVGRSSVRGSGGARGFAVGRDAAVRGDVVGERREWRFRGDGPAGVDDVPGGAADGLSDGGGAVTLSPIRFPEYRRRGWKRERPGGPKNRM